MKKRGQVAIEYLMIMGFSLFVISVLMLIYSQQSTQQGSELTFEQVNKIGHKIVDTSQEVFYRGIDARKTITVYMPPDVINSSVNSSNLLFKVKNQDGVSDLDYASNVQLQGKIPISQGVKHITIVAKSSFVCIVEEGEPECP